jgi:transposase InsO family protein
MVGPRGGPCVDSVPVANEQTAAAIATLHQLMQRAGEQPAVVQTDRAPCFVGAEGSERKALPGRFTLWLWGLGIDHQILPPAKPWRNGAVERLNGALEHSWRGEEGGRTELIAVWNHGKTGPATHRPYADRAGFELDRVWDGLATSRVARSVDAQGKLSVWDRPLRIGTRWAGQTVIVTFDGDRRLAIIRDKQERVLREVTLPWLTDAWLWDAGDEADQALDHHGISTL